MDRLGAFDKAISVIYDGTRGDGSWEPALEAIRDVLGCSAACLRVNLNGSGKREFLTAVNRNAAANKGQHWENRTWRHDLETTSNLGEVLVRRWEDIPAAKDMVEQLRADDVVETLFHCFARNERSDFTLALSRGNGDPRFDAADIEKVRLFGQHFAEAIRIRDKINNSELIGRCQAEALDHLAIGGLLVDRYGGVLALNEAGRSLLDEQDCLRIVNDTLIATDRLCNVELQGVLRRVFEQADGDQMTHAMTLERKSRRRSLGIVIYGASAMCSVSNRMENSALIFARDSEIAFSTDTQLLQKLFSFTPAEANLAIGLAKGQSLFEIETCLKIRHNTARAHLRAMFIKADVTRQAELVSLLTNSVASLGSRKACRSAYQPQSEVA